MLLEVVDELHHFGSDVDLDRLEDVFRRARRQVLEPVTVAHDLGILAWVALSERHLPGFEVVAVPVRNYPNGTLAAHLTGFVGSVIDDEEAARLNRVDPGHGYRPGSEIGRSGLERLFERHLRGIPEVRRVEVDSSNRVVRTIAVDRAARPGLDVHAHPAETAIPMPAWDDTPIRVTTEHRTVDVVVVGRGESGLEAAAELRGRGRTVEVFDATDGAEVVGAYPGPLVVVRTPERMLNVECNEIVVATGASEIQPIVPGSRLEGLYTPADAPVGGAVIAPPHPLYGGSMDSPVVTELAQACARADFASLRFNWRGAGASAGE